MAKRFFQEVKGCFYFLHDQINSPKKLSDARLVLLGGKGALDEREGRETFKTGYSWGGQSN